MFKRDHSLALRCLKNNPLCINCGETATQAHHIVPLALGGKDVLSNLASLCDKCHDIIHHGRDLNRQITHSEAVKEGIKNSCKVQGRKTGQLDKLTPELQLDIIEFINNRNITQISLMKKHSISRNTLKKYIEIIKEKEKSPIDTDK